MNKKGFTLVEVLAALLVLALVTSIGGIAYTSLVGKTKLKSFEAYEKTMYAQSMQMMMESMSDPSKDDLIPDEENYTHFTLDSLEIDPFNNPRNKNDKCSNSYVDVYRNDYADAKTYVDAFVYKVCLICPDSDYNVNGDNCTYFPNNGSGTEFIPPTPKPTPPDNSLRGIIVSKFNDGASYIEKYNSTSNGAAIDTPDGSGNKAIYYYTSKNTDNLAGANGNVILGNYCWKIVRTTANGGVKLLYNGLKTSDNKCPDDESRRPSSEIVSGSIISNAKLSGEKIYGTSFDIIDDNGTKKFKLKNTRSYSWSVSSYLDTISKYVCGTSSSVTGDTDTCTVLYYVGYYNNDTESSAIKYKIINNYNYTIVGETPFNLGVGTLATGGYMYNDLYPYDTKTNWTSNQEVITNKWISTSSYYYGDKATWNPSTNMYDLTIDDGNGNDITPTTTMTYKTVPNSAKGMYTCMGKVTSCSSVYYVIIVNSQSILYGVQLNNGESINEKVVTWTYGTSYTKNGDSYTINDPSTITILLKDWYDNYSSASYKHIYVCSDFTSSTCSELYFINSLDNYRVFYHTTSDSFIFGNSVTYQNGKYTINTDDDTLKYQKVWDWYNDYNKIYKSHYTCFKTNTNDCGSSVYFIFYSNNSRANYIELKNGEKIEDAVQKMININNLSSSTINKYNSALKGIVDSWFESTMLDYEAYLDDDAVFCNDRAIDKLYGWDPDGYLGNGSLYDDLYAVFFNSGGSYNKSNAKLGCPNITDRFSKNNSLAKLKYSVGLLTEQERVIMQKDYAKSGAQYWLLTPIRFRNGYLPVYYFRHTNSYGVNNNVESVTSSHGVTPAIVLKPGVEANSGTGSYDDPYIILTTTLQ